MVKTSAIHCHRLRRDLANGAAIHYARRPPTRPCCLPSSIRLGSPPVHWSSSAYYTSPKPESCFVSSFLRTTINYRYHGRSVPNFHKVFPRDRDKLVNSFI